MIDDAIIKVITEISNSPKLIERAEPSLMWHPSIDEWMVRRIGIAILLFQEAYELRGINPEGTGTLPSKEQGLYKGRRPVRKLQKGIVHPVPVSKVKTI